MACSCVPVAHAEALGGSGRGTVLGGGVGALLRSLDCLSRWPLVTASAAPRPSPEVRGPESSTAPITWLILALQCGPKVTSRAQPKATLSLSLRKFQGFGGPRARQTGNPQPSFCVSKCLKLLILLLFVYKSSTGPRLILQHWLLL